MEHTQRQHDEAFADKVWESPLEQDYDPYDDYALYEGDEPEEGDE